jgi:hypothetical protein
MLRVIAVASLAALVSALPLAASAQTTSAPPPHHHHVHKPTGSYRSQMRNRHNASKARARAGAEHVRQMRMQQQ